jgi:hypothetical protein
MAADADDTSASFERQAYRDDIGKKSQIGAKVLTLACAREISGTQESASAYIRTLRNALRWLCHRCPLVGATSMAMAAML